MHGSLISTDDWESKKMSRAQDQITHCTTASFAGIDVGKVHLDLQITPANLKLRVPNSPAGIGKIVSWCRTHAVQLTVLEATGVYHRPVHEALCAAGLGAAVVNPVRTRQFAESLGRLAKTDAVDAQTLSRFAQLLRPEPTPPSSPHQKALRALTASRRQLLQEIGDIKRRLQTVDQRSGGKPSVVASNALDRQFEVDRPDKVRVTDIT